MKELSKSSKILIGIIGVSIVLAIGIIIKSEMNKSNNTDVQTLVQQNSSQFGGF